MYLNHFKTILGVINPSQCKVDGLCHVMINVQSVSLGILERVGISRLYKLRKYAPPPPKKKYCWNGNLNGEMSLGIMY